MVVVSSNDLSGWNKSFIMQNKSDIATLLSAYKKCTSMYSPEHIQYAVERDGYYGFVLTEGSSGNFDLFQFINSNFSMKGIEVNCANALLLFPEVLSRGEYTEIVEQTEDEGTGVFEDEREDSPTGLLDDIDEDDSHYIVHQKTGTELPIDSYNGVVIGRSVSRTDYSVDNNMLSRIHARVYMQDGKYFVEDLGSRNGTFVNNVRVHSNKSMELHPDSTVRLANEEFKFF